MRLLLVMPTGLQVGYDAYFSSSPLGIETVAAHVRDCADVTLFDLRGKGHDVEAHADELLKHDPNMIGVSMNSASHTKFSLLLAEAVKRRRPDVKIVFGGQQATFLTEEMMAPGHVDAVIREVTYTPLPSGKCMICEITLRNGYTVRGESACVSPANFDVNIGRKISFKNAREKIWGLEAYLLQERHPA